MEDDVPTHCVPYNAVKYAVKAIILRLDAASEIPDDGSMIRPVLAAALALLLAAPARADFSSCVASIKSEAARQGVSAATLKAAFDGLQPDAKVLEFETSQPEFKTPIWDYLAALVDDERVTDGKAAMAANAGALARAEERFGVSRYVIAAIWGSSPISATTWAIVRWCNR